MNTTVNFINSLLESNPEDKHIFSEIKRAIIDNKLNDTQLLHHLISFFDNKKERDEFWEDVILEIDPDSMDDKSFDYFVRNKIALDKISHLKLNDSQLVQLCNDYDEAYITLLSRYCNNENATNKFLELISACKSDNVIKYMLSVPMKNREKKEKMYALIEKNTELSNETKIESNEWSVANNLEVTEDVELIVEKYNSGKYLYLLSISKNINTPLELLEKMKNVSQIKYSTQIRNNSKQTIKIKMQN